MFRCPRPSRTFCVYEGDDDDEGGDESLSDDDEDEDDVKRFGDCRIVGQERVVPAGGCRLIL